MADVTEGPVVLTGGARRLATIVVLFAFFMDVLDSTIVNVAIPSIEQSIGADPAAIQWIIAGYLLAFSLFLITGGRLGDIFGYKRMFLVGMAGFTLASTLCGLSSGSFMLILARLFQGAMAAVMVPQIMSTIQILYPHPLERQGVSAFYGALAGVAAVLGPVLGAFLIAGDAFGLGWRSIFMVNLPVGIVAFIMAAIVLPDTKSPHPLNVDVFGILLTIVALFMLVYPLIEGRELGWPAWSIASMLLSLPILIFFAWTQVVKERVGASPLVVPSLFGRRSFLVGVLLAAVFFAVLAGYFLVLSVFMQIGAGFSVLEAGLTGIPFSIAVAITSGISGPMLVPRFGRNVLTTGALGMAVGIGLLWIVVHMVGAGITPALIIPPLIVAGMGMGAVVSPIFAFVLSDVPLRDAGSASGLVSAIQQVAGAIGVALVGLVFFSQIRLGSPVDTAGYVVGFQHAAIAEIGALLVVAALTRFLPRFPRTERIEA
ncbi:DHA2 family efflux MFS transporter permease subunit [Kaistia dalseonensis]|uniref:EmrB/QacA subfamily drug resistance transporter n=1 Tax=Kaistia dalseonensis TaxID=410840 RepID=A0ABU0H1F6_9HYPH|nr:DHA2 family efflux MFS transporter permease subunit [Kaistia dalseonensis]MCX5493585.1 DHA2 family efflux MFS transporter permease subunit [Kaistia dalseonensis]MDQ0436145.1 EmrB/QacA subfamily drug resistance transporter [Kaistia dalseonensis]